MSGETDLEKILGSLQILRRAGAFTIVTLEVPVVLAEGVDAVIAEAEGTTVVVSVAEAERRGWPVGFEAAWLTVEVHSSLEAVGLTAALSSVLADRGISCNVLAGYFHDHLLVPFDRADEAVRAIESLR